MVWFQHGMEQSQCVEDGLCMSTHTHTHTHTHACMHRAPGAVLMRRPTTVGGYTDTNYECAHNTMLYGRNKTLCVL